jgi:hypothetical protein
VQNDIEKLKQRIARAKQQIIKTNKELKDTLIKKVYDETHNLFLSDFKSIEEFKKTIKEIFSSEIIEKDKSKSNNK